MAKIPINISTGEVQVVDTVLGIDLGTTNSLVAVVPEGETDPVILRSEEHHISVPSLIYFESGTAQPLIGEKAKEQLKKDPENTIYSVKRFMGKSYKDMEGHLNNFGFELYEPEDDGLVKISIGEKHYTPIELSAEILKSLKSQAQKALGFPVQKAVITVPAYFNDAQRQATRDAGKLAGLDVLRIVNEPTAASLAYGVGLNNKEAKTIAVYDLGGGTFDISILRIEDGIFEVLSTNGDTFLGGDDVDHAIVNSWSSQLGITKDMLSKTEVQALRLLAEEAKKQLSQKEEYATTFRGEKFTLTQDDLRALALPIVEKTLQACTNALEDAELSLEDIEEVILVGGSTRLKSVYDAVRNFFSSSKIDNDINPDEVVALGAAVEGDILAGNRKDILLLDVTPLSLGIETMGGLMDVIVPRNSKVPTKASRTYTTSVDGQVNLKVAIFQGERDQVSGNRKLAEFNLQGIPAMPAGFPKIEISFLLDADGILHVSAKEIRSGVKQEIEVKPQYGLTDEEVEKMLKDSLTEAEADRAYRKFKEAKNEAEYLILSTEKFLKQHENMLEKENVLTIKEMIKTLQSKIQAKDADALVHAHQNLEKYTAPFAEEAMDSVVSDALQGKDINKNAIRD
jgi:molecular chaperone HscA